MRRRWGIFLFLATIALLPAILIAQEVLTNEGIVTMKKAGLSDRVILAKIRASEAKFDISAAALAKLKQAGVSDEVIEAMVTRSGPPSIPSPSPTPPPHAVGPGVAEPRQGSVYHLRGDKYVELEPAYFSVETNRSFFNVKSEMVLKGRKAHYRISDRTPTFVISVAPTEMPMVRLKPGDEHDDRNLKVSTGDFNPWGGSQTFGVRTEDMITVSSEKDLRGFYRVTPRQPLPAGEYGFVHIVGRAAGRVFDFGVD